MNSGGKKTLSGTGNAIWNKGKLEGFRCYECGSIEPSMYNCICSQCRAAQDYKEAVNEVTKELMGNSGEEYETLA
jgi:hypothetical protein